MTIIEMNTWFDILQDKGDSPYFTINEKMLFLNRAQTKYVQEIVNRVYFPSSGLNEKSDLVYSRFESMTSGEANISPLIGTVKLETSSDGRVEFKDINDAIDDNLIALVMRDSGFTGSKLLHILGAIKVTHTIDGTQDDVVIPCRFVSYKDRYKNRNDSTNVYRRDREYQPTFRVEQNRMSFSPVASFDEEDVRINYIREPIEVNLDLVTAANNIDCELPDFTHDEIMAIALDDAGVASRDQALMTLNKASKENLSTPA